MDSIESNICPNDGANCPKQDCINYSSPQPETLLFVPPSSDKAITIAGREKIPVYLFVDPQEPSVLYIKTYDKAKVIDNSVYGLSISALSFDDGQLIEDFKEEFITSPNPAYVGINDVLPLCNGIPIEKRNIAYFIKESSKIADYWASRKTDPDLDNDLKVIFSSENIKEDYYPFYMFVKYRTVVECIKEFYISAVSNPSEYHDVLSDLEREEKMDLDAIKKLLDSLNAEADDWIELVATITADPEWALRGKYSFAVTNYNYKPYHPTGLSSSDWNRGY